MITPEKLDSWRIVPRLLILAYMVVFYQTCNWFMDLPDPNNAQAYAWKVCTLGQAMFRGFSDKSSDELMAEAKRNIEKALEYMGLKPDTQIEDIKIDRVFIGSCTNSRIEDLEAAAQIVKNKKVNSNVNAMVVPGSTLVKSIAEQKGLDKIFKDAGFEWREAGCSMCLGMNPDILQPKERCASTSNRNFEGRQGKGGRTHLVSPEMAAAAAIAGHFVDTRDI